MNKKSLLIRLYILLFTVSISTTVIPCGIVQSLGLFGEMKFSTVKQEKNLTEAIKKHIPIKVRKEKGIPIINIWLEIWICIISLIFIVYNLRLPRKDTIVTLKVRMNN